MCFSHASMSTRLYAACLIGKTVEEAEEFIIKEMVWLKEKDKDYPVYEMRVINEGDIYAQDGCTVRLNVSTSKKEDGIITEILWLG